MKGTIAPTTAPPTVTTTTPATGVTTTDATIAGNITNLGLPTASSSYGFVYSTTASTAATLQLAAAGVSSAEVGTTGATTGSFNTTLTGLTPGTTYYYRAYATNATGTGYGLVESFTTVSTAPTITVSATSLASFSTTEGTPSAAQNYTVSGTSLTTDITVTPPTGYEIAIGAASTTYFTTAQTLPQTGGSVATTTIRVRLTGTTTGTYGTSGTPLYVTNASTGATQRDVAVNGVVNGLPTLTVAPAALTGFSTTQGTPSAAQSYTLSGTSLTSSVTVTAPTGYQVSQTSPTAGFANTQTVTQAAATTGLVLYVRLTGTTVGTYGTPGTPVNLTNAATGATTQTVALDGTTSAVPFLTVTPATLSAFNTLAGTPSAALSYSLSGSALTADVLVTAPAEYEVSQTSATAGFAPTQTLTPSSGSVSATIYVRLTGATAGTFGTTAAPLQVSNASAGAVTKTVDVKGTVVGEPATTPAPTVVAGTTTATSVPLTLTAGAGTNLLVVVRPDATAATAPTDGTTYTASTTYGSGTALGAGRVVFAAANATSVTVTGLTPSTSYVADVYSYNVGTVAGFENYQPAGGTSAVFTTPAPPVAPVGNLLLEEYFDYPAATVLASSTTVPDALTGWTAYSGNNTNNIPTAASNQLQAQYPQGAALSASPAATSSQASLRTNGQDIFKPFTLPAGATTIYISAVVNVTAAQAAGDYFLNLYDTGSGGGVLRSRVFARSTTGGINFGVSVGGASNAAIYSPTVYALNTPYLLVTKYETNGTALITNDDIISLYVIGNSATPTSEPATPTATSGPEALAAANTGLNAVALRQGSASGAQAAPTVLIDGLRVASGWGAAVGRPVYTATAATIAPGNYYDVTVNNADVLTLNGAVKVEGSLNLTSGKVATSDANLLTLYATATTSGGSATSFVNGPLARVTTGPATTVFPVGQGAAYRPLTLNATAQGSTTTYTAKVQNSSARTTGVDLPLTRVSNIRYATITPDVQPTGFSGTLTMAFDVDDYVTDPQDNTFVMAKRNGSANWVSIGRTNATGNAASGNVAGDLTSDVFTSFSDFALASTSAAVDNTLGSNPLPVELTAFSAQRQSDKTVTLKWNTASEKNSARFEVQRSLDGREYKVVAAVAAQGASTQATAYAALDKTAPAGRLYYRLRQVDLDGSSAFSPVVTVAGAGETAKVELYPNPAHSRISFIAAAATPYRVLNQLGQPLLRGTTEAGTASIGIEALPAGLYFLELQTANGRTVQKFEKE